MWMNEHKGRKKPKAGEAAAQEDEGWQDDVEAGSWSIPSRRRRKNRSVLQKRKKEKYERGSLSCPPHQVHTL